MSLQDAWLKSDMQNQQPLGMGARDAAWVTEFGGGMSSQQQKNQPVIEGAFESMSRPAQYAPMQPFHQPAMSMGMYGMGMSQNLSIMQPMENIGKGKGKMRDEEFEAAFAHYAQPETQSAKIEELKDDLVELENGLTEAKLDDKEPLLNDDFEKVWESLQNGNMPPPAEDMAKWEAEFSQLMQSQRDDLDYESTMRDAWENGLGSYDGMQETRPDDFSLKFDDEGIPLLDPYTFEIDNKYTKLPPDQSALALAKKLLEANGPLTEAGLLLEAAIQRGDLGEGGYEAWILLGETRSMDEREDAAMRALAQGVRLAEAAGSSAGLLSLAISFTNESYQKGSHTMLLRWIRALFPEFSPPDEVASVSPWASHDRVKDALLAIARHQHQSGVVDPDVQTALGVLFYTNGEFEHSKDCFEAALGVKPNDYLLWNRLGSSLSNGNKPEEALGAYREALAMRPTYTRAIYNVGVACLNIGAHKEAAEHFLSALSLQESGDGEKSEQLWFTLRRALLAMGRQDLAEKAQAGGKVDDFRAEGFDFN